MLYASKTNFYTQKHAGHPTAKVNWSNLVPGFLRRKPKDEESNDVILKQAVTSSNIERLAYNSDKEILQIIFNSGGIYHYYDVPEDIYNGLINAPSVGKYFWRYVRDVYDFDVIR